jgi:hypothetical protein
LPVWPQLDAPASLHTARESAFPLPIIVHLPRDDGSAQLRQAPAQALSQHTPSTHCPDLHSLALPQLCPFCLGPQVRFTQAMPWSHSSSVLQMMVQAAAVQRKGEQFSSPGARHVPRPSQVAAVFRRFPEQTGAMHWVSTG